MYDKVSEQGFWIITGAMWASWWFGMSVGYWLGRRRSRTS
jgi:hypothetical protein